MANTTKKETTTTTEDTENITTEDAAVETKKAPKIRKLEKIDPNEVVDVQSCVSGELIYISRMGYKIVWDDFGSINQLSVSDLMDIRNAHKRFFEEPWIMIIGDRAPAIIAYLQVSKYYKTLSSVEDYDNIFEMEPSKATEFIKKCSNGTKEVIARRAFALIHEGTLDSLQMIDAVESATGYSLKDEM